MLIYMLKHYFSETFCYLHHTSIWPNRVWFMRRFSIRHYTPNSIINYCSALSYYSNNIVELHYGMNKPILHTYILHPFPSRSSWFVMRDLLYINSDAVF